MDKLAQQAHALLNDLQGVLDQIRQAVEVADSHHATLQPKLAQVADVEARLSEKADVLKTIEAKLTIVTAQYEALRQKLL